MSERLATLISGGGTTMQEIIKACQSGEIPMNVACVVSSTPTAGGIEKARKLGIPEYDIIVVNPDDFRGGDGQVDQESFGIQILKNLRERGTTVVTQNGWLPLTPKVVIDEYPETMFNQHPGPVPEFGGKGMYGRRVHAARLLFTRLTGRDSWTEAIAQRVHNEYDQGSVVKATRVDILPDDTVDDLQQRVLPLEHRVQIDLLKDVASGNIRELAGREKLVRPGEEQILFLVKRIARVMYPHG
ncbi:phosphoribosylglycinamide formyltransferase [Candidatus Parcubacteria bacterium]|nr:MAG: phosphoribosylglycinamide formyltransferase [Candidatus Parcubacteria bacterium]